MSTEVIKKMAIDIQETDYQIDKCTYFRDLLSCEQNYNGVKRPMITLNEAYSCLPAEIKPKLIKMLADIFNDSIELHKMRLELEYGIDNIVIKMKELYEVSK